MRLRSCRPCIIRSLWNWHVVIDRWVVIVVTCRLIQKIMRYFEINWKELRIPKDPHLARNNKECYEITHQTMNTELLLQWIRNIFLTIPILQISADWKFPLPNVVIIYASRLNHAIVIILSKEDDSKSTTFLRSHFFVQVHRCIHVAIVALFFFWMEVHMFLFAQIETLSHST